MVMRTLRENVKWIMVAIVILFCLSIFGMYGFGSRGPKKETGAKDYAVAEIDGKKVMRSSLERNLSSYVERANIKDITSADVPRLYQATLDNMVIQAALSREAEALGVIATDEEVEAQIKEIENQFPTKEAFQQYIEQNGIDMKDLRKSISNQLAQMRLIEESTMAITTTDEEVADFYEKAKTVFFHQPEGFTVKLARFKTKDSAQDVYQFLDNYWTWDEALEVVSSSDITDVTSGDATAFVPVAAFTGQLESVRDLPLNKVSEVLEVASDDFLLVMKTGKVEESFTPFEEVSGDVRQMIEGQKKQQAQSKYIEEIKNNTDLKILDESLFPKPEEKTEEAEQVSADKPKE